MLRDILGNKQTIILFDCLFKDARYDILIIPQRQKVRHNRSKKQTKKKVILSNKKRIINSNFSRTRNAVSEFDSTAIEKHQRF